MKGYIRIVNQITFSVLITSLLSNTVNKNYSNSGLDGQMSSKDVTKNKSNHRNYMLAILDQCLNVSQTYSWHCSGSLVVRLLASSAVNRAFERWSRQTKDSRNGICCFSAKR